MGLGSLDPRKAVEKFTESVGLPAPPLIDPIEALADPGGTGQQIIDIFRDPLSSLQGLPGIDGSEPESDGGQLEVARQGLAAQDRKKKALVAKKKEGTDRQATIKTGPQGLAEDDTASIATRTLLG